MAAHAGQPGVSKSYASNILYCSWSVMADEQVVPITETIQCRHHIGVMYCELTSVAGFVLGVLVCTADRSVLHNYVLHGLVPLCAATNTATHALEAEAPFPPSFQPPSSPPPCPTNPAELGLL